jgi:hypothetical protein
MTTQAEPPAVPPQGRIGIWGAPASGKTTYLAALRVAVDRAQSGWWLYGQNTPSTTFLTDSTDQLVRKKVFPEATIDLPQNLEWVFRGNRTITERTRYRFSREREVVSSVLLDLLDAPGGMFGQDNDDDDGLTFGDDEPTDQGTRQVSGTEKERLLDHLASCDGLIYLFDPTRERTRRDSYNFFQSTVLEIAQRSAARSRDRFLPQNLAVCITKFDHPYVYEPARKLGYTDNTVGAEQFPFVPGDLADEFFTRLCESDRENSATLLSQGIKTYFSPERTRYFVTSAVGFYLDPKLGRFQQERPWNVIEETGPDGDISRILGEVYPINVLEPMVWLAQNLLTRV